MNLKHPLTSIKEALIEIKKGNPLIVVDDKKRENEGDFIMMAEKISPAWVNFFLTHARGLLCVALSEERCLELELDKMVKNSTDSKETNFTFSIDLIDKDISTGISAFDRSKTIKALSNSLKGAKDFQKPGHIFPLIAKKNGVLERPGHTEAAIDLARLSECFPASALIEILNEDGSMARLSDLIKFAKNPKIIKRVKEIDPKIEEFKIISIEDLIAYRKEKGV